MNFSLHSIAGKTLMIFVGVFVLIIWPVNTLIYLRIKSALEESETRELKAEAERLLEQVRLDPIRVPLPRQGFSIKVQARFPNHVDKLFDSPDFPLLEDAYFSMDAFQLDTLFVVNCRKTNGDGELLLSLARHSAIVRGRLTEIRNYLWLANGMSIAIACVLVFLVTAFTTRPIQRIIAVADRISASGSMERVPVPRAADETRALAETLNSMIGRLEYSIKQQTNFFASAAHELKTPLSVMKTELTMALTDKQDLQATEILESCLKEVERLSRVIHNFLLISQLKNHSLSVHVQATAPEELLYSALKKVRFLALDKKSILRVQLSEESHQIKTNVDSDLMETVFINILENAIQHSAPAALIHVQLEKTDTHVILKVINPVEEVIEQPQELLREFNKVKSFSPGFGMGLWICDQVLQLHHGDFHLGMDSSGENFVVSITLQAL